MLEILGIVLLINKNKANALARGKKPGLYMALTLILWLGMEFLGGFIGGLLELDTATYFLALALGLTGGLISYIIAKSGGKGNYISPTQAILQALAVKGQPLASAVRIDLVREPSVVGMVTQWKCKLNGNLIGSLGNGKTLTGMTRQKQNVLQVTDPYGNEMPALIFEVQEGARAEIHFKINRFILERSQGITLIGQAALDALIGAAETQTAAFCLNCGQPLYQDGKFCMACGTPRYEPAPARPAITAQALGAGSVQPPRSVSSGKPIRCIWALLWISAAWLADALIRMAYTKTPFFLVSAQPVTSFLISAITAAGFFLLTRRGAGYKIGGAALLLSRLMILLPARVLLTNQIPLHMAVVSVLRHEGTGFFIAFILVLILSLLFSKTMSKTKTILIGWLAAVILFIPGLFRLIRYFLRTARLHPIHEILVRDPSIVPQLINNAVQMIFIGLTVTVFLYLSEETVKRIKLPVWGMVWCILCSLSMAGCIIFSFHPHLRMYFAVNRIFAAAALAGYLLLIAGRKNGWYVVLLTMLFFTMIQLSVSLPLVFRGNMDYLPQLLSSLLGCLNPLITWLAVRNAKAGA